MMWIFLLVLGGLFVSCSGEHVVDFKEAMPNQPKIYGCYKCLVTREDGSEGTIYFNLKGLRYAMYYDSKDTSFVDFSEVESVDPEKEALEDKSFPYVEEHTIDSDMAQGVAGLLARMFDIETELANDPNKAMSALDNIKFGDEPEGKKLPKIYGVFYRFQPSTGCGFYESFDGSRWAMHGDCVSRVDSDAEIETSGFMKEVQGDAVLSTKVTAGDAFRALLWISDILKKNGFTNPD